MNISQTNLTEYQVFTSVIYGNKQYFNSYTSYLNTVLPFSSTRACGHTPAFEFALLVTKSCATTYSFYCTDSYYPFFIISVFTVLFK